MEKFPINDIDPSLSLFRFNESEREEMLDRGMSEADIEKKEAEVRNRQAQAQLEKERKAA